MGPLGASSGQTRTRRGDLLEIIAVDHHVGNSEKAFSEELPVSRKCFALSDFALCSCRNGAVCSA